LVEATHNRLHALLLRQALIQRCLDEPHRLVLAQYPRDLVRDGVDDCAPSGSAWKKKRGKESRTKRTLDSQNRRVNHKLPRLVPRRIPHACRRPLLSLLDHLQTRLLQLLLHRQPPSKLHRVERDTRRTGLLHFLDGREGFIVRAGEAAGGEGEDGEAEVGEGEDSEGVVGGRKGKGDGSRFGLRGYR
jgi:hypothetical protein